MDVNDQAQRKQNRKRLYCDCGFDISSLSGYHTAQHKKSKRHRQAMLTATKMQRLDDNFTKASTSSAREEMDLDLQEFNDTPECPELVIDTSNVVQQDSSMPEETNDLTCESSIDTNDANSVQDILTDSELFITDQLNSENDCAQNVCQGFVPNVPEPFLMNYPFQLHLSSNLPFTFTQSALFSLNCLKIAQNDQSNCTACSALASSSTLRQIESRAQSSSQFANNRFLTYSQLVEKIEKLHEEQKTPRLLKLNSSRRLSKLASSVNLYKRLLWCLGENDIPRVKQLLNVCLRKGASVNYILDRIQLALNGAYHAKGFQAADIDIGLLVLRIGGPRLVHALHQVFGIPSVSLLYKQQAAKFTPSISAYDREVLWLNLSSMLLAINQDEACGWVLLIDEVACEQRVRWNADDNKLYGICREHGNRVGLSFNSVDDVHMVVDAVQQSIIHLASEVTIVSVAPLRQANCTAIPLLALPTCKAETSDNQREMIKSILEEWRNDSRTASLGPVVSVSTDSDATRRLAFDQLLRVNKEPSPEIACVLQRLTLMDTAVGIDDVVVQFDDKHIIKRFREVLKSYSRGSMICNVKITGGLLKRFLDKLNLPNIDQLLHPDDAQNVSLAVSLLKAVAQLSTLDCSLTPSEDVILTEVKVLSFICECLSSYLFTVTLSLQDQLENLSSLSHTLIVLYKRNGTKFIPAQLYHDCQALIKCAYLVTIRMQQQFPGHPLYLFQLGTDRLEGLFSVLRTLTHNANFDMLQCGERLSHATQISQLYQVHPEWKRAAKRLQGSQDHMNPTSWVGSTSTDVDVIQCWFRGRIRTYRFLISTMLFTNDELDYDGWSTMGFTMDCPCGSVVGSSIDQDELSEPNELEEEEASLVPSDNTADSESDNDIDIEDVLPVDGRVAKGFIEHEGRMVHKASVVRILFSSDPKSSDRLRRVRGMSKHATSPNLSGDIEDECLCIGDPCCTLVRTQAGQVCLAFFLVESITNLSAKKVSSLAVTELSHSNVKITGPVAVLKDKASQTETGEWIWDRSLGALLATPGSHVHPVNPDVSLQDNSQQITYHFNQQELSVLCDFMWSKSHDKITELASTNCKTLPYLNSTEEQCFVCFASNELASKSSDKHQRNTILTCKLCQKGIKKVQMRLHVGFHILKGDCLPYPCGFCGQSYTCTVEIKKISQHYKGPNSDCEFFYKFSLASTAKCTARSPCTNVPMLCQEPQCNESNSLEVQHGKALRRPP